MRKIVLPTGLHALQMNLDAEVMAIACQWRNIAMELSTAPMEVMKICAALRQTRVPFQTTIVKISQDSSLATTPASLS